MIDLYFFRYNKDYVIRNFKKRGFIFDYDSFFELDDNIKLMKTDIYLAQREHKLMSFFLLKIGHYGVFLKFIRLKIDFLKKDILDKKNILISLCDKFDELVRCLPNLLCESVPFGRGITDNVEIRTFINSKNNCDVFNDNLFKDFEINKNYLDFDLSAKISGSGFVILRKSLAELHRAVGNYMLDRHVFLCGYEEIYSPLLVNSSSMYYSGHFPKFKDDQFGIADLNLWLIPTGEVVLVNLFSNSRLKYDNLPLKLVSKTSCFRKEKGNYGYIVKGMIRQHQFDKVELVHVVEPSMSYDSLEELVFNAESILRELDLPYRVLSLCSADIGFSSSKTYDLEVWMPKRKVYLEVSSCSNTESFQARRMNAKIQLNGLLDFPHILNGSGLAIGRIVLSIVENYSDSFGNIIVPDVLVKYMNGKKYISF